MYNRAPHGVRGRGEARGSTAALVESIEEAVRGDSAFQKDGCRFPSSKISRIELKLSREGPDKGFFCSFLIDGIEVWMEACMN